MLGFESILDRFSELLLLLILLIVANGAPIIARKLLLDVAACPLDCGRNFLDGKPLFGISKTVRGLISSLLCTALAAPLLGLSVSIGLTIAVGAMLGDLLSSFIKRRLSIAPSRMALGLDQIPESLIPLLLVQSQLNLCAEMIVLIVVLFLILELILSRILFYMGIRDKPY